MMINFKKYQTLLLIYRGGWAGKETSIGYGLNVIVLE